MSVLETINSDLKSAMKDKDEVRTATLRQIKTAVMNAEIKTGKAPDDEGVLNIIFSLAKSHNESIESFKKGNRPDLAEKEEKELAVLMHYLPKQLTEDEIRALVSEAVKATCAQSAKDMGKLMGFLMPKVKGRADGAKVNAIVKEFLK